MIEKIKNTIFILAIITIIITSSCLIYLTTSLLNEKKNSLHNLEREEEKIKILYKKSSQPQTESSHFLDLLKTYSHNNISDEQLTLFTKCLYQASKDYITEELNSEINNLANHFEQDHNNFAFYYEDLNTGFTLSFNADQQIFAASIVKAPVAIYIYDLAQNGKVNLDDKLIYTKDYYLGGTGIIKDSPVKTEYTIRELVKLSITKSDNIALKMLVTHFGINNIKNYWQKLGATSIYQNGELFGNINAKDGALTMRTLYTLQNNNNDLSRELLSYFTSDDIGLSLIKGNSTVAHKYGWSGNAIHDIALVEDKNPYILVILTTKGEQADYESIFTETSNYITTIHTLYNDIKEKNCISTYLSN